MSMVKWWGAPTQIGESVALSPRLDQFFPETSTFENAQPLTIRVRGVMILEDYDWVPGDKNDIMIVTTTRFGSQPPVQRLHFMQHNVEKGWEGGFFNDVVLAIRDINIHNRTLTLRIQVYDMDGVEEGLVQAVSSVSQSVAVAFPHLAPYAAAVSFGVPALLKLVDNLNDHDRILDERLTLEIKEPGRGHRLLQPGYFVCFKGPVEKGLFLSSDLRVLKTDRTNAFQECSYAVLQVERQFHAHREWEIDQKMAKLIAELNGKGQSGKAALEFLRETLDTYDKFRRLERARELKAKETLSESEQELLQELTSDEALAPFLTST